MVQSVGAIAWQDTAAPDEPVAAYVVNFATDTSWVFGLQSIYHGNPLFPVGVMVDNSANSGNVTLTSGPNNWVVVPFTRTNIRLPINSLSLSIAGGSGQSVPISFYIKEPSDAGQNQAAIQLAAQQAVASAVLGTVNPIINSKFDIWSGGTTIGSTGAPVTGPDGWQINAANGQAQVARGGAPNGATEYGAQIGRVNGQAGVGVVQFGTALETVDSFTFVGSTLAFGFDVAFGGGFASQSPLTWRVVGGTGTNEGVFNPFTGQVTLLTGTVAYSAAGQRVTIVGNAAVPANITEIGIIFSYVPNGNAGANEYFSISRVQFDTSSIQSFRPVPSDYEQARLNVITPVSKVAVVGSHNALKITTTGGNVVVTANELQLKNATTGNYLTALNVNLTATLDTGALAGATTYFVHVGSNGAALLAVYSLSQTTPTFPAGYTYRAVLGSIRTNATPAILPQIQNDREVEYVVDAAVLTSLPIVHASGSSVGSTSVPTYVQQLFSGFAAPYIPATAGVAILMTVSNSSTGTGNLIAAPNSNYGALLSTSNPAPHGHQAFIGTLRYRMTIESQAYYLACGTANIVMVAGYIDNIF